jgi:hypothetical protein
MVTHHPQLVSSELAMLWSCYVEDTMALCVLKYFLSTVEDPDAKEALKFAMEISEGHLVQLRSLFKQEDIAIPVGFSDNDVNLNAPRLFSDIFMLRYLNHMARVGSAMYAMAHTTSGRSDIRQYFVRSLNQTTQLYDKVVDTLIAKGIFVRPPVMNKPEKAEFVQKQSFLTDLLGEHRPLTAIEIAHISKNTENNSIGSTLLLGFSQVAHAKDVRVYMNRGHEMSLKHSEILRKMLIEDKVTAPAIWDSTIEKTTVAPFSDKLMMFHVGALSATGIGNYGVAAGASFRIDLAASYTRMMAEVGKYAEAGARMMIANGWLEQPPQAADRKELQRI